jgi:hypothetical protein
VKETVAAETVAANESAARNGRDFKYIGVPDMFGVQMTQLISWECQAEKAFVLLLNRIIPALQAGPALSSGPAT